MYQVQCPACGVCGPRNIDREYAIQLWNALSGSNQDDEKVMEAAVTEEIKQCPRVECSGFAFLSWAKSPLRCFVKCSLCGMSGPTCTKGENAIQAWNALPRLGNEREGTYNPTLDMNNCLNQECGQKPVLIERDGFCLVQCNGCFMCGPLDKDVYRAVELWNALSNPPSQECANESQVEELDGVNHCPMCGECPEVHGDWWPSGGSSVQVACECGVHGSIGRSEQEAIEYWNMLSGSDGGWISVEDELPEPLERVMVLVSDTDCPSMGYLMEGRKDCKWWCVQPLKSVWYQTASMVTHWRPLPELPVVESKPVIQPEGEWISVENGLPEWGRYVEVLLEEVNGIMTGCLAHDKQWHVRFGINDHWHQPNSVTHWRWMKGPRP